MFGLYKLWVEIFYKLQSEGKDSYLMLCSTVLVKVLYERYLQFLKEDIPPIESLTPELKTKYWNAAKKYYQTEPEAIKASKACYVLDLITSSE